MENTYTIAPGAFKKLILLASIAVFVLGLQQRASACACVAPNTVVATAATGASQTGFTANWNAGSTGCGSITDYQIDLSTDNFATSVTGYPTTIGSTATNTVLTGLTCGTTYYYRIKAYSNCSLYSTSWSNVISVSTSACSPCAGTPTAGTATATATSFTACTGGSPGLSLFGVSPVTGLTYQWQSSSDTVTWTNVAGATSSTYTPSVTSTTYFHCVVTCSNSGLSANSVYVTISVPPPCTSSLVGGYAIPSVSAGCASYTTSISVSGNTYCGVTYQWQSSPDNSTWTNVAGGTSSSFTTTVAANTYYKCVISCTGNGSSTTSSTAYCQLGAASNDLCSAAGNAGVVTTAGYNTSGNNLCATLSTGGVTDPTPTCSARNRTLWYKFTTPAYAASYTVSVVPSSMTFAGVAVYSGTCGSFTQVGCNYPASSSGIPTVALSCLTANTTYYIMVYDNGSAGSFFLNITSPACNGGDAEATVVTKCSAGAYASTMSLINTLGCVTGYQWQTSTNNATWSNVSGATSSTYAATISSNIYYQCVVTCSDGSTSSSSSVYASAPGSAPVNDACASALSMAFSQGINSGDYIAVMSGNNTCATADGTSSCFTANKSLWYKFTAPAAGNYNIMIESDGTTMGYPELSIKTGTCAGFTEVSCAGMDASANLYMSSGQQYVGPPSGYVSNATYNSINGYSPFSQINHYYTESGICGVTAGQTVYIMVDNNAGFGAAGNFTLTVATLSNDGIPKGVTVSTCGAVFNSSTIGATNCDNGAGYNNTFYNNLDNNTATGCNGTTGASCGTSGGPGNAAQAASGNGGDVGYSVENDSWYQFCVVANTTVTVNFQPVTSSCLPASSKGGSNALQISVFTGTTSNLTKVDGGYNGQSITSTFISTFSMSANQCCFVEVDGYAGTNCDYQLALTMNPTCVLPVEILSFNSEMLPDITTKLTWAVGTEQDADHYVVEKSFDNMMTFTTVGMAMARGNSTSRLNYQMFDKNPGKGVIYYKLSVVDYNGVKTFLGYAMVTNKASTSHFYLFPNPAQNSVTLGLTNFSEASANYELYDAQGTVVKIGTIAISEDGGTEYVLDISSLNKGIYFIRLTGIDEVLNKTFVKSE